MGKNKGLVGSICSNKKMKLIGINHIWSIFNNICIFLIYFKHQNSLKNWLKSLFFALFTNTRIHLQINSNHFNWNSIQEKLILNKCLVILWFLIYVLVSYNHFKVSDHIYNFYEVFTKKKKKKLKIFKSKLKMKMKMKKACDLPMVMTLSNCF